MSNLLINESPLMVLPSLATKIGLNEAMFLQQLHYLMNISRNERDGKKWVYNSYQEWEEIYPFWSQATIKRIVSSLKSLGLIYVTHEYNRMKIDKTNWFSINYEELELLSQPSDQNETSQNDPSIVSNCNHPSDQIDTMSSDQIDTTNNHQNKTTIHKTTTLDRKAKNSSCTRFDEFWDLYLHKVNRAKAKQIWINKKLDNMADEIIEKLKHQNDIAYSRHLANKEKGYIPHPTTYLNGERWDDDLAEVKLKRASQDLSGQDYANDRGFD